MEFRVWDGKRMHYSADADWHLGGYFLRLDGSLFSVKLSTASVRVEEDEFQLKQELDSIPLKFTGFKDSKGKEIFDEDIISLLLDNGREVKFLVFWDNNIGVWRVKQPNAKSSLFLNVPAEYSKIIGNIYENPELLIET